MTLELFTELKTNIEARLNKVELRLRSFPTNEMGLVINKTPEYIQTKKDFQIIFNELRILNRHTPNKIKIEYSKTN